MINEIEKESGVLKFIKSLTLLCVEDSKTTRLIYKLLFEGQVKKIIFASDGEEGCHKFVENDIDIIITDNYMPKLDGLDMIEIIRKVDKTIPIILVSAIEDISVITKALQLNVNNFIQKPIKNNEVLEAFIAASKVLIANRYIKEQRNKKIKELEAKEKYSSYQEDLAFSKELNILRNDFYYQMKSSEYISLIDFLYQPLDIMSGDAYSARKIDEDTTFYLLVDGMGKGLSASLSAMLMTSFINYLIDNLDSSNKFDFKEIIRKSIEYIKPILLDEEALAIDYILMDCKHNRINYAKFAMPFMLLQDRDNKIVKIKSNNPPLSKYQSDFNVSSFDVSNIFKFLFCSDGMVENNTKFKDKVYLNYIEDDFKNSFTREDIKNKFFEKITVQEDDVTLIFINRLDLKKKTSITKIFNSSLDDIDKACQWYDKVWGNFTNDNKLIYKAGVVFTELFTNAYEHGNLGITSEKKHMLLENDEYFETLLEKEKECFKKITVKIDKMKNLSTTYIITQIFDEGVGFDTQILSEIFRNSQKFNGRGVFVSRQSSLGILFTTTAIKTFC